MTGHIGSDLTGGVLTLTLNRPEKKNALTRAMYRALGDGIDWAGRNSGPWLKPAAVLSEPPEGPLQPGFSRPYQGA